MSMTAYPLLGAYILKTTSMNYPITASRMLYDHTREALRAYLDTHVWKGKQIEGAEFDRLLRDVFAFLFSERPPEMHHDEDIHLGAYFEEVVITGHGMTPILELED